MSKHISWRKETGLVILFLTDWISFIFAYFFCMHIFAAIYFVDCRIELYKSFVHGLKMDIILVIYFCDFFFLVKINRLTVLIKLTKLLIYMSM